MSKEEEMVEAAASLANEIVEASRAMVENAGASVVVIVEFEIETGHASALGGNRITAAPRMLATALSQIPGGPEYVAMTAAQARATKQ